MAQLIELSCKCGTNYMLRCGLAHVWVESSKIVPKIRLSPKFGACAGGNSENGTGNIFPAHYKECSLAAHYLGFADLPTLPFLLGDSQFRLPSPALLAFDLFLPISKHVLEFLLFTLGFLKIHRFDTE